MRETEMTDGDESIGQGQRPPTQTGSAGNLSKDEPTDSKDRGGAVSPMFAATVEFFKTTSGQIIGTITGVLVAAVGGWVSPLGDVVKDQLWPENIEISGEIPANEKEKRELRFILQTKSRAGFSGGTVSVSSPDHSVEFFGDTKFIVPATPGSTKVPEPDALAIKPLTSGNHIVRVLVETERGKRFKGELTIVVAGLGVTPFVGSAVSYTGTWRIILNGKNGTMKLVEDTNKNLSGLLTYESGESFKVNPISWTDGTVFFIELSKGLQKIQINGFPCEVSNGAAKWRVLNGKVEIFEDGRPVPYPVKLSSIRERCEQMIEKLDSSSGDGAFEAHIGLK
jgi:hypothetical protein